MFTQEKVSVSLSLLKDSFGRYSILGWQVFSFSTLIISSHSLLACNVSVKKSTDRFMVVLFVWWITFLLLLIKFSWSLTKIIVCLSVNCHCYFMTLNIGKVACMCVYKCFQESKLDRYGNRLGIYVGWRQVYLVLSAIENYCNSNIHHESHLFSYVILVHYHSLCCKAHYPYIHFFKSDTQFFLLNLCNRIWHSPKPHAM